MELWKGAAIGAMLLAIGGYGVMQNRPLQTGTDAQDGRPAAQSTPQVQPEVQAWIGREPLPWSFTASSWANTPKPLTLADIRGKVALLEFWRRGCSHCEEAVPFMNSLRQHFGARLPIITFQSPGVLDDPTNEENSWLLVKQWMKEHAVSYPVAFDEGRKLKDKYKVALYPFVLLIGKDGKIVYAHTGHTPDKAQALAAQIQKLVGK